MGVYAVTGSASGMGQQAAEKLRAAGHRVIGVDLRDADVIADLSTADGRAAGGEAVLAACEGRLDGAVLAAGVGPAPRATPLILQVNYFGVVELLEAWRPALAAAGAAKVVVVASNSTTTVPAVPRSAVRALLAGKAAKATRRLRLLGPGAPSLAYAASKIAVSRWVRRRAVEPSWAGAGIRLNALAPGAIMTPLLERQLATPGQQKAVRSFPIPVGGFGDPGRLADWMLFMLSDAADFLCGSVIFVDGGSDAYFRSDDWPRSVGLSRLPRYLMRFRAFRGATPPAH
ncbi:short-chain type dehydrogenase/reductase [Mycolicibacter sinensis]|uniref:Short-chain type dehydrogenase/reductase n=2 Tax=Mycobacteriaceae TaxID=1762 RepID=F5Z1G1_MYCSD|nr:MULTISPECIES: SDR family oxidoreductase [Mycobacteriaceae]AEF37617.1 short-chain type dehydrogenase/reductase [Mycolicibacter sinensis]BBX13382.1 NAD-dependent epimerase [Mycobacterium novum]